MLCRCKPLCDNVLCKPRNTALFAAVSAFADSEGTLVKLAMHNYADVPQSLHKYAMCAAGLRDRLARLAIACVRRGVNGACVMVRWCGCGVRTGV